MIRLSQGTSMGYESQDKSHSSSASIMFKQSGAGILISLLHFYLQWSPKSVEPRYEARLKIHDLCCYFALLFTYCC